MALNIRLKHTGKSNVISSLAAMATSTTYVMVDIPQDCTDETAARMDPKLQVRFWNPS